MNVAQSVPTLAAIPAILLAVVVLIIGQNVAAYRELERAANQTREIYEAVKDYLHVTKVGSPERGMRYIASRLPILQEVRNRPRYRISAVLETSRKILPEEAA